MENHDGVKMKKKKKNNELRTFCFVGILIGVGLISLCGINEEVSAPLTIMLACLIFFITELMTLVSRGFFPFGEKIKDFKTFMLVNILLGIMSVLMAILILGFISGIFVIAESIVVHFESVVLVTEWVLIIVGIITIIIGIKYLLYRLVIQRR